jgi:hypothetical protein
MLFICCSNLALETPFARSREFSSNAAKHEPSCSCDRNGRWRGTERFDHAGQPTMLTMRPRQPTFEVAAIALCILLPREGLAAIRGRRLDEEIANVASNVTYGSGTPAAADAADWEVEDAIAPDAMLAVVASLQPRVTVVEGLRSRNGIASISNPGMSR